MHKTPRNAIRFIAVVSLIAPRFGREAILWIVNMSALRMALGYSYTSLVAAKLSRGTEAIAVLGYSAPAPRYRSASSRS